MARRRGPAGEGRKLPAATTPWSAWNLAGEGSGSIYDHLLQIDADGYNPVTPHEVPTGKIAPVAGTPFDFTRPVAIGERIRTADDQLLIGHGYDHNYALRQPEPHALVRAARVVEASSGRVLEVHTTQPGLQLYTGNGLQGTLVGTGGGIYRQGDALALAAQHFPDAPKHPSFASARLDPGDVFRETIDFQLSVEG